MIILIKEIGYNIELGSIAIPHTKKIKTIYLNAKKNFMVDINFHGHADELF
jgi:hypothetical protein